MRKLQICTLVLLAFLCASCHKDDDKDVSSQPMAYCMTDEQRAALSNMKQVDDSLFLFDFGTMDYRLDEMLELCNDYPDFTAYMNEWAHGMFLDLPEEVLIETTHTSCSAYAGRLADGSPIMGRNMDMDVRDYFTGDLLPVTYFAVHTKPANGYESIGFTESSILCKSLRPEQLKDGRTDISFLAMLPYVMADGINSMGLSVAQLTLFGNPSSASDGIGTQSIGEMLIVRTLLDKCKNVDEAIAYARNLNPQTVVVGNDLHYLVTDADGNCAVLEWVKAIGGFNELQVVTDATCISNTFCSQRAKELSQQQLLEEEVFYPFSVCWQMIQGNEEYLQRYFNFTPADTTAVFNCSFDNCKYRLGSLQNAYDHPQGGISGVFADTDEAMNVLSEGFSGRTEGPLWATPQGPGCITIYGCIFNSRDKTADVCLNENVHKQYHFSFDQFK